MPKKRQRIKQPGKEEAILFYESGQWKDFDSEEIVKFQLFQHKLCMPFNIFHKACNKVFDRLIFSHEFANTKKLKREYLGKRSDPTSEEILEPIKDKVTFFNA